MNKMNKKNCTSLILGIIALLISSLSSYAQFTTKAISIVARTTMIPQFPNPTPNDSIVVCPGDSLKVDFKFFYTGATCREIYTFNKYLVGGVTPTLLYSEIKGGNSMDPCGTLPVGFMPNSGVSFTIPNITAPFYISSLVSLIVIGDPVSPFTHVTKVIVSPVPTAPKTINVIPAPPLPLGPTIPPGGKALLQVVDTDPTMNYLWYTKNPNFTQLGPANTSITTGALTTDTTFFVVGKQKPGVGLGAQCGSTLTPVPIFVRGQLFIPNVFAPNGSNPINRKFQIKGETINSGELIIFNQWGNIVFQTKDLATGWDGRKNGILQPSGVYIFILKGTFVNGKPFMEKGSVTLIQ